MFQQVTAINGGLTCESFTPLWRFRFPPPPRGGVHETGHLVFMKPFVGGGDESKDSNATPKTTAAGPRGRQFRVDLDLDGARHGAETH
jgi:hypothetical protein